MQQRKIVWEKWLNPLTGAGSEDAPEPKEEEEGYKDSFERDMEMWRKAHEPTPARPKQKLVISPLGFLPLEEHADPAVVYGFWLMHTNFDITPEVQLLGSTVAGVESWNTFTRYRARVSFGKLFTSADVKMAIQKVLGCESSAIVVKEQDVRRQTLERLKKRLSQTWPAWAIFQSEDGQFSTARGPEQHVRQVVENTRALPNPPKIFTSWEA